MSDILNEFYLTVLACITSNFQDSFFFGIIQLWDTICNGDWYDMPGNFISRVLSKKYVWVRFNVSFLYGPSFFVVDHAGLSLPPSLISDTSFFVYIRLFVEFLNFHSVG